MPSTDSDPSEATLTPLRGVWIHDPADPQGTVVQFLYARAGGDTSLDSVQAGTRYAGRTYPVTDYSEFENLACGFTIQVIFGDDYAAQLTDLAEFVRLRATVCVRDGRGRRLFATLIDYRERDETFGTTVTFTAVQVDYDESVIVTAGVTTG